jgi:hypothetical protein
MTSYINNKGCHLISYCRLCVTITYYCSFQPFRVLWFYFSVDLVHSLLRIFSYVWSCYHSYHFFRYTFTVSSRTFSSTGRHWQIWDNGWNRNCYCSLRGRKCVAVRRTNIGQNGNEPNLLDVISPTNTRCAQYCGLFWCRNSGTLLNSLLVSFLGRS